jgi:putative membrane-bound dehydrogenase-like protein
VSENAGVNLNKAELNAQTPSSIRMLEDTNGDGVFDKSTVFADRMTFPQGALWHDDALFAASPPSMWRLDDTNGDGVADARKAIATGFDFTGNAADIHGPFLSPTGRIFWAHGRKGHEVHDGTRLVSKALGARIWSSRPDGTGVEPFAGGGMDNPVEVAFSDEGDIFGTANIFYGTPRADAIVHWIYGGVYPRTDQEQALADFKRTGELLAPAINLGHVAPAGIMRVRSNALRPGDLLFAEFNTHRIMRAILEPRGSTFTGRTEMFLSSSDPDVHFTDVLEDADGSLLVVNTGGWFTNGCPTSGLGKPEAHGTIYRVRRTGARPVVDPRGLTLDWTNPTAAALTSRLADLRFAVRDRAVAALGRMGDAAVPELVRALTRSDRQVRLQSVWALTRIDTPAAHAAVRRALADRDAGVRQAAARSIFTTLDAGAAPALVRVLADPAAPVRREAAAALGRLDASSAVPSLLNALGAPDLDRTLEHALVYALIEINEPGVVTAGLQSRGANSAVQRGALWALDQMPSSPLTPGEVLPFLDADDASLRSAALMIVVGRRAWSDAVAGHLRTRLSGGPIGPVARELIVRFGRDAAVQAAVGQALARADLSSPDRLLLVTALGEAPGVQMHPSWMAPLTAALASSDRALTDAAIAVIRATRAGGFEEPLGAIGRDPMRDPLLRVAALQAVQPAGARGQAAGAAPMDSSVFDLAAGLAGSASSVPVRVQAADMLARAALTQPQMLEVARLIETAGPLELRALIPALPRSRDAGVGLALLQSLAKSPGLLALTEGDIRRSFRGYPPEVISASSSLVQQLLDRDRNKEARLTQLSSVLGAGDANRGRQVFASGKGSCIVCHRIGATGGQVGPDLSRIGGIRTGQDLLAAIAYPSDNIARGYETPSPISLMPPGLETTMSRRELGDLIAYLKNLQ